MVRQVVTIRRSGKYSAVIRIPKEVASEVGIKIGDRVMVEGYVGQGVGASASYILISKEKEEED